MASSVESTSSGTSGSSYHADLSQSTARSSRSEQHNGAMGAATAPTSVQSGEHQEASTRPTGVPTNYVALSKCAVLRHLDMHTAGRFLENTTRKEVAADIVKYKSLYYRDYKTKQVKERDLKQVNGKAFDDDSWEALTIRCSSTGYRAHWRYDKDILQGNRVLGNTPRQWFKLRPRADAAGH